MPDELDDTILRAMKTLDDQVPSGYFEALPNQILARLEDGTKQHGSGTMTTGRDKRDALLGPPVAPQPAAPETPAKPERSEDSGLHDIRNLAQSTKQRLSSKRVTQSPTVGDDALASSGSWKHVALPEPAKMVSLPELAQLPSKEEVRAAEKAAKKEAKTTKKADAVEAAIAAPAAAAAVEAAPASVPVRQAFSLPSQQQKSSKGPLFAIMGLGLAAAAGGVIYMQLDKSDTKEPPAAVAATETTARADEKKDPEPAPAPAEEVAAAAPATEPPQEPPVKSDEPEADAAEDADEPEAKAGTRGKRPAKGGKGKKAVVVEKEEPKEEPKVEDKKPDKPEPKKPGKGEEGEPSFDALLKEAGVEEKKEAKPKLEKKSLSGEDFKKGMAGIAAKAQGCYKGTQGTAMVKLTVAPSGKVSKATVAGQFAGTPEGACVVSAVKAASFPPWDGGPQSFSYSYMLAD